MTETIPVNEAFVLKPVEGKKSPIFRTPHRGVVVIPDVIPYIDRYYIVHIYQKVIKSNNRYFFRAHIHDLSEYQTTTYRPDIEAKKFYPLTIKIDDYKVQIPSSLIEDMELIREWFEDEVFYEEYKVMIKDGQRVTAIVREDGFLMDHSPGSIIGFWGFSRRSPRELYEILSDYMDTPTRMSYGTDVDEGYNKLSVEGIGEVYICEDGIYYDPSDSEIMKAIGELGGWYRNYINTRGSVVNATEYWNDIARELFGAQIPETTSLRSYILRGEYIHSLKDFYSLCNALYKRNLNSPSHHFRVWQIWKNGHSSDKV